MTPPDHRSPSSPTAETDHPQPSNTSTPNEVRDGGRFAELSRTAAQRLRRRVPSVASTTHWLRSTVTTDAPGTGRIPPRMRTAQVGAAVAAVAVTGVIVGHSQPEDGTVTAAAHTAPLAAPAAPAAGGASGTAMTASFVDHRDEAEDAKDTRQDHIDEWIDQATDVLKDNGVPPGAVDEQDLRTIIEHESGGNPAAANNWDSNASAGTPSKGLMQTIDPTFQAYALPGHQNIWNPVDNIVAATRYSIDRYGAVSNTPGVAGTDSGGGYEGY